MSDPYLPPGTPGPRKESVELTCVNPACGATVKVRATRDMGMLDLDDAEPDCPDCRWEVPTDDTTRVLWLSDEGGNDVFVDTHEDEVIWQISSDFGPQGSDRAKALSDLLHGLEKTLR